MRIISETWSEFFGTHKGHYILIEKEGLKTFYIKVWGMESGSYSYDGYAPETVTPMAAAKREAKRGAMIP